jgi:hypothetical protein
MRGHRCGRVTTVVALVGVTVALSSCQVLQFSGNDSVASTPPLTIVNDTPHDYFVRVRIHNCPQLGGQVWFLEQQSAKGTRPLCQTATAGFLTGSSNIDLLVIRSHSSIELRGAGPRGKYVAFDVFGAWCDASDCYDVHQFT